jgi:hypothetical protein
MRRTREELQELLLVTGADILLMEGLRGGVQGVTLPRVFEAIEETTGERISPGSVYERIWSDQRSFQLDVLKRAGAAYPKEAKKNRATVTRALSRVRSKADTRDGARSLCAATASSVLGVLQSSRAWLVWMAVYSCTASTPELDDDDAVLEVIRTGYQATENLFQPLVDSLLEVGFEPRNERALREFLIDAAATAEGMVLRARFSPQLSHVTPAEYRSRRAERAKIFFADSLEGLVREEFMAPTERKGRNANSPAV